MTTLSKKIALRKKLLAFIFLFTLFAPFSLSLSPGPLGYRSLSLSISSAVAAPCDPSDRTPAGIANCNQYQPLAPLPGTTVSTACNPSANPPDPNCKTDIQNFIPQVFKLSIAVAGALAVIMIMIGGVKYITAESMGGKEGGRETINNAVIGLLLAIGAYIILYTINPGTLSLNLNLGPTGSGVGVPPPPPPLTCSIVSACNVSTCYTQCPAGSAWPSDFNERLQLTSAGIGFNNGNCPSTGSPGQVGCTSVFLLPQSAITGLINLKSACSGCTIMVTGGTEFWSHLSHGPMLPKVDLRYVANDALDQYIRTNGTVAATCVTGSPAWSLSGRIYVLEKSNHWHICN